MAKFQIAHCLTSVSEGFYSNDPTDSGGETLYGIARNANPSWAGWPIVDSYKKKAGFPNSMKDDFQLKSLEYTFYKANYWDTLNLDSVINQEIANEAYDTAVNMGVNTSAKFIQQALNLLNKNNQDYPDLAVDGKIGPVTLNILNTHKYPKAVLRALNGLQFERYASIVRNNPAQERFMAGWLINRL